MESALIASDTLVAALESGRFDARFNPRLRGPNLVQRTRFPDTSRHARDILERGAGAR